MWGTDAFTLQGALGLGCPTRDVVYAETVSASPSHPEVALFSVAGVKQLLA